MMDSDCNFGHSPIIDSSSATTVCTNCCLVLEERLSHDEVGIGKPYSINTVSTECLDQDEIFGEPIMEVLKKISDKLHLYESCVNHSFKKFNTIRERVRKILEANPNAKRKRLLLSNENVLVYSIYISLKEQSCPRSIKEICHFSGISKPINILKIEKFLELNRNIIKPIKRAKPITAKDIILTHFPYIEDLLFEDVKQIFHRLNGIQQINFSPSTTSAGAVYLYMNFVKKSKKTLTQVSTLFNVTPMSIQRFVNKFKNMF